MANEESEPKDPAADSVIVPETSPQSCLMIFYQCIFREIVNANMERQLNSPVNDSIAAAAEEDFSGAFILVTEPTTSRKNSALNNLVDVSIFQMIESGCMEFCLGILLKIFSDLIMFMDLITRRMMTKESFASSVAKVFIKTVHDQVEARDAQVCFLDAVREPHVACKLEPFKITYHNQNNHCPRPHHHLAGPESCTLRNVPRASNSNSGSKNRSPSSSREKSSSSASSGPSCRAILVMLPVNERFGTAWHYHKYRLNDRVGNYLEKSQRMCQVPKKVASPKEVKVF